MSGDTVNPDEVEFKEYDPPLLPFIQASIFDCGNQDLNDFLKEDVDAHYEERLAQTMLILHRNKLIGFFCLLTDSISLGEAEAELFRRKGINYRSFPAVKIGRLGISKGYQRKGVGLLAVKVIAGLASRAQKHFGCRFLTVDSKPDTQAIAFWEGIGFKKNLKENLKNRGTISYRYDLLNPLPERNSP